MFLLTASNALRRSTTYFPTHKNQFLDTFPEILIVVYSDYFIEHFSINLFTAEYKLKCFVLHKEENNAILPK